jgi:hypothetical protein
MALIAISESISDLKSKPDYYESPPERIFSKTSFGSQIKLEVKLTRFGERLASACGIL